MLSECSFLGEGDVGWLGLMVERVVAGLECGLKKCGFGDEVQPGEVDWLVYRYKNLLQPVQYIAVR